MFWSHHGAQFAEMGKNIVDFFGIQFHLDGWIGLKGHRDGVKRAGTFPMVSGHGELFHPVDRRVPLSR